MYDVQKSFDENHPRIGQFITLIGILAVLAVVILALTSN